MLSSMAECLGDHTIDRDLLAGSHADDIADNLQSVDILLDPVAKYPCGSALKPNQRRIASPVLFLARASIMTSG